MTNQSRGRKISQFNTLTGLPSDSKLTFISGSQNYTITLVDFLAALGVTGIIQQEGDPLGTPILNKAGAVNNIRNLEPGPGIKTAVSAMGGAEIEHNFSANVAGVPVLVNLLEESPLIRSIQAGAGIQVTVANDAITIATSEIPTSSNVVIVDSLDKLPAPVSLGGIDTIILEEFEYVQDVPLSSPYPLAPPINGKQCTWKQTNRVPWTYTETDACFKDPDANGFIEIDGLTEFRAPNGKMFDVDTSTGSWGIQAAVTSRFRNCKELGFVGGGTGSSGAFNSFFGTFDQFCDGLVLNDINFNEQNTMFSSALGCRRLNYDAQVANFTLGETVTGGTSGATGVVEIDRDNGASGQLVLSSVAGVFQDNENITGSLSGDADVDGVLQDIVHFTVQGANTTGIVTFKDLTIFSLPNETIFDIKPEILAGVEFISIESNKTEGEFLGTAFAAGSLDRTNAEVLALANTFIPDSVTVGAMGLSGNAVATSLTTGVYEQIEGVQIASDVNLRASVNGSEQLAFSNRRLETGTAIISMNATRIGSGTNNYLFALYKNGSIAELTGGSPIVRNVEVGATDASITFIAPVTYVDGDVFDVRINRQGGTADLTISDMVLEVK